MLSVQLMRCHSPSKIRSMLSFLMLNTPQEALKELEACAKRGDLETIDALVGGLPRVELEKLVRAGLKRGKLIDNLSRIDVEELRESVCLCSHPKSFLSSLVFIDALDPKRQEFLLVW